MIPNEHLADQLRSAYDCYLEIMRRIQQRMAKALQRNAIDEVSFLLCAPCFNELENEPQLSPRFLATMDGNNSLKLVDSSYRFGTTRSDDRTLPSVRWLEPEVVDEFKDETKASEARRKVRSACYSMR
jgi:hypothetical protein